MKNLLLIIKGFIIGTANIIPGVSGGTIMMTLGVFEDIIYKVGNFFEDIKGNFKFFGFILIGLLSSLILMSRVITYSLNVFNVQTILFFVGLICGGVAFIYNKIDRKEIKFNYILSFLIPFIFVVFLSFISLGTSAVDVTNLNFIGYITLFLVGVIAAASMVIPGLSGSFMLILFGYYEPIITAIKEFTSFTNLTTNFTVLTVFGIGVLIGIFFIIRLIMFLLEKFKNITYYAILGFVISSIIAILITNFSSGINLNFSIIISSVLSFIVGLILSLKLGD